MIHTDIDLLSPILRNAIPEVVADCIASPIFKAHNAGLIVVETLREIATQMAYFARGRMNSDDVKKMYVAAGLYQLSDAEARQAITWTLSSKHLLGRACDCAPSLDGSSPWWAAPAEVWQEYGRIAKSHGLQWGGDWKGKVDTPHVEA